MQPSGGVDDDHVTALCLGGLDAVIDHGGRVRAFILPDNARAGALRPDLQLVCCRRTEGITCHQGDLLALVNQLLGNLADGGGFAHAVDTDHQDHRGLGGKIQLRAAHIQHFVQNQLQIELYMIRNGKTAVQHTVTQFLHQGVHRIHAHIRKDQCFFQIFVKFLSNIRAFLEHIVQGSAEERTGLAQTLLDFFKKSHILLLIIPQYPGILPSDLSQAAAAY